jgi:hypothetical protein
MTEQQPYEVVRSLDGFEVRRYPEHVVAETQVSADFEGAGNRAASAASSPQPAFTTSRGTTSSGTARHPPSALSE